MSLHLKCACLFIQISIKLFKALFSLLFLTLNLLIKVPYFMGERLCARLFSYHIVKNKGKHVRAK